MGTHVLFENDQHACVLFEGFGGGAMISSNQFLIRDGNEAILLDPGGHKVHYHLLASLTDYIPANQLRYLFFSHQDPDIVAAANAWLMVTDADAYISKLWTRFIPHFGIDELMLERLKPIPDEGMRLPLGNTELVFVPAHFLHSTGNFQVYDPISKILFTGDLGASLGQDYTEVSDFDAHVQYMEGFHFRYMPSNQVNKSWANMVSGLEIDRIAPQHGAIFPTPELSRKFIDWIGELPGAIEKFPDMFTIPA